MANDLNQCNFTGRLGKDPELRNMPSGDNVANFTIAVGERWKDKQSGEPKEKTTWVPVVVFGKLADIVAQYAKKGRQVRVTGKFVVRQWEKDGEKRYSTEIHASEIQLLGSGDDAGGRDANNGGGQQRQQSAPRNASQPRPAQQPAQGHDSFDDDIPF